MKTDSLGYTCSYLGCDSTATPAVSVPPHPVEQAQGAAPLKIYPNPAQDLVYLFIDTQELQGQVHIYNAMGMPVMTQQVNSRYTDLNVAQLANGVYFCRFTTDSGKHTTGKFVILR